MLRLSFFLGAAYKPSGEVRRMGRVGSVAVLALLVSACAVPVRERVQELNRDGVQLFDKGEYDHAREEFQAALHLQPLNATLLYNLGQCYDRLGQTSQAEQIYHECLQSDPNYADCRHALTAMLVNNGRVAEARSMVRDWLRNAPNLAAAYAEDGWLYQLDGDPIAALKRYQQAIDRDPRDVHALIEMASIYEELNYPSRALLLYQIALDYNPQQPDIVKRVNLLKARGVKLPHPES
jgi:tetratricopeptide (TPR) repeat protein